MRFRVYWPQIYLIKHLDGTTIKTFSDPFIRKDEKKPNPKTFKSIQVRHRFLFLEFQQVFRQTPGYPS